MSIINDALKKATDTKEITQNKSPRILIWAGTAVVCILGIILAVNSFKGPADSAPKQQAIPEAKVLPRAFQMREVDFDIPTTSSDFHLSGILYDSQKPFALINDRVVTEGASINGAKVLEISPNYVRLTFKGEDLTLKIK